MVGPISLASVMTELEAVPQIKFVGTAADLRTALAQKPPAYPAVYVQSEERGSASKGFTGVLVQNVQVALQLVLFVSNANNPGRGTKARAAMDVLINLVRTALLGWRPIAEAQPLEFLATRDEGGDGAQLISQEVYRTNYTIQVHL